MLKELQTWEDNGECELHYFGEEGFSQSSSLPSPTPGGRLAKPGSYRLPPCKRLNVVGFMSRQGQFFHHTTTETVTTDTVTEAFDQFVAQKASETYVVIVLENASMHCSKAFRRRVVDWMARRVQLVYLSPYSPELNPIEILWREIKYRWLPLTAYGSFNSSVKRSKKCAGLR